MVVAGPTHVELVSPRTAACRIDARWTEGYANETLHLEVLQRLGNETFAVVNSLRVQAAQTQAVLTVPGPGSYLVEAVGERTGIWRTEWIDTQSGPMPVVMLRHVAPRSGILLGRVTDTKGRPHKDAGVRLHFRNSQIGLMGPMERPPGIALGQQGTLATDESGDFAVSDLLPGTYTLEVRTRSGLAWANEVKVADSTQLTIPLEDTGTLEGTSACASGSDLLWAELRHTRLHLLCRTPVEPSGFFCFRNLVPGAYDVQLRSLDPIAALHGAKPLPVRVNVRAAEVTRCTLSNAERVARLVVRLLGNYTAADLLDAQVERLHPHDRVGHSVWKLRKPVPSSGQLRIDDGLPPGQYMVSILHRTTGALLGISSVLAKEGSDATCDITIEPTAALRIVWQGTPMPLRVAPTDSEGTLARDTFLSMEPEAGNTELEVRLPPGNYALVAADSPRHIGVIHKRIDFVLNRGGATVAWHSNQ